MMENSAESILASLNGLPIPNEMLPKWFKKAEGSAGLKIEQIKWGEKS